MAEPREIKVKLTADVAEYVAAMKRARKATRWLPLYSRFGYWSAGTIVGFVAGIGLSLVLGIVHAR